MSFLSAAQLLGSTLPHHRRRVNDLRTWERTRNCSVHGSYSTLKA